MHILKSYTATVQTIISISSSVKEELQPIFYFYGSMKMLWQITLNIEQN